jgi:hypothetical protein
VGNQGNSLHYSIRVLFAPKTNGDVTAKLTRQKLENITLRQVPEQLLLYLYLKPFEEEV